MERGRVDAAKVVEAARNGRGGVCPEDGGRREATAGRRGAREVGGDEKEAEVK